MALPPDVFCHFDNQRQLGLLVVFGNRIARYGAGEPALGAKAEVFQGQKLRRLVDAPLEVVRLFQFGNLR